jgi:hypothetical protein
VLPTDQGSRGGTPELRPRMNGRLGGHELATCFEDEHGGGAVALGLEASLSSVKGA